MAYGYADFYNAASKAGLLKEFDSDDLKMAAASPEKGLQLLQYKQDWHNATTPEARSVAEIEAGALRKTYQNSTAQPTVQPNATQPTAYATQRSQLLQKAVSPSAFSYDPNTDPSYAAYAQKYQREGKRATEDTLARAAAQTGGLASSYAVTAAAEAGNRYASELTDKATELEQMAYQRYLNDIDQKYRAYDTLNAEEQQEYNRGLDARNWNYQLGRDTISDQRYLDETAYNRGRDSLSDQRYTDETTYNRGRDAIADQRYTDETAYNHGQDERSWAYKYGQQAYALQQDERSWNYQLGRDAITDQRYADEQSTTKLTAAKAEAWDSGMVEAYRSGNRSGALVQALLDAGFTQAELLALQSTQSTGNKADVVESIYRSLYSQGVDNEVEAKAAFMSAGMESGEAEIYANAYMQKLGNGYFKAQAAINGTDDTQITDPNNSYIQVWKNLQGMYDQGKATQEITATLRDALLRGAITDEQANAIIDKLKLEG